MRSVDRFVAGLPAEPDGDLMLCREAGIAWQHDRSNLCTYDAAYFDKCASYAGNDIASKVIEGRVQFVADHFGSANLVDVGIGSGEFIKARPNTIGHDVNPVAIEWLKRNDLWCERLTDFRAFSFWDVLEHIENPALYLDQILLHSFVFLSVPIMYGLGGIRLSKHYRPGEHLTYFEERGLIWLMESYGFRLLEMRDFEIAAGRESIYDFAFKRITRPRNMA